MLALTRRVFGVRMLYVELCIYSMLCAICWCVSGQNYKDTPVMGEMRAFQTVTVLVSVIILDMLFDILPKMDSK